MEFNDQTYVEKIVDKYSELDGQLHMVELTRFGTNGLGMSLAGNRVLSTMSVFVVGIQPDSPTGKDGRLRVGDQLLEINGQTIYGRSHLNASAIIKGITDNNIHIVLLRRDDYMDHMAVKPLRMKAAPFKDSVDVSSNNHVVSNKPAENSTINWTAKYPKAKTITLTKGSQGLGFAIQEGNSDGEEGIYVKSVTPGGVAASNGSLSTGDRLLQVQQHTLETVNYTKAIELIRNCPRTDIQLTYDPTPTQKAANQEAAMEVTETVHSVSNGQTASPPPPPAEPVTETPLPAPAPDGEVLPPPPPEPVPEPAPAPAPVEPPATAQITPGKETLIEIQKGKSGLGLSIVGGADTLLGAIIIHEVYEEGAAAKDGRLWAGDQILSVCDNDLRDATHDRAIQVLRQTPAVVQMCVFRDESLLKDEEIYDIFTVDLMKKPGKGLGLSIVGRRNDTGVFISDIVKGGAAEADGRLQHGDQILAVNGEDMKSAIQEHAAAVLKTLMGKVSIKVGRLKAGSRSSSRRNSSQSGSDRGLKKSESNLSSKNKGKHTKRDDQRGN